MSNNHDNSNDSPSSSTPEGVVDQERASTVESNSPNTELLTESGSDERDAEEETWTNQPRSSSSAADSDRFPNNDDDEEEEDDDGGEASDEEDGDYDDDDDYEYEEDGEDEDYPEDDEAEESDDSEGSSAGTSKGGEHAPRKQIQNARDVVCDELPDRVARAALRLKPYLSGSIVFHFTNSGERFLFDWRGESPSTRQIERSIEISCDESKGHEESDTAINVDAVISISEANLMAVRAGSLNPQVGMLTEKIRVKGKIAPAVYVFNAVAPRSRA
jgi:hypothetical protein